MIFIWISIAMFGLMDVLGFISIIQEHRKNKKDYARGLDDGYKLAERQFQPLQDRWGKLKEWVVKENSHAGFFDEQKIQTLCEIEEKMQELEDGKDTNVSTK